MAKAEDTITLLVSHKSVWLRLSEFNRWDEWLKIPGAAKQGLGESLRLLSGEGTEMRFGFFNGDVLSQTLRMTEWDPPRRLAMALEGWNWKAAYDQKTDVPEARGKMVGSWGAYALGISVDVEPISDLETRLVFRMESQFIHPFCGPLFNLIMPVRRQLARIAADFTARFTQSFERRKAA